jgi:ABC-type dipeptide/oligopeptide/nickel transport system permease component
MPEQPPPPSPWVSQQPTDGPVGPVRRSGVAVAALVFGVLSLPLALTVYLGMLTGALGVLLGLIGLYRTRGERATGRGMAVAGLVVGVFGLGLAISLYVYGMRTYRDCEARLGRPPSHEEVRECVRTGG